MPVGKQEQVRQSQNSQALLQQRFNDFPTVSQILTPSFWSQICDFLVGVAQVWRLTRVALAWSTGISMT